MAHGFGLAEAGKADRARAFESAETDSLPPRGLIKVDAGLLRAADLEQQRLLEHQRAVAGDGVRFTLFVRGRGGAPAGRVDGHWTTSRSAASKRSMSSSVTVSVTATASPLCSASAPG